MARPSERNAELKLRASALGLDACHVAAAGMADPGDLLGRWLERGFHADMAWMERSKAVRQDPRLLLPGARSVVVAARNYYAERPPASASAGKVARYAWGRDYHKVLKKPLRELARWLDSLEAEARSHVCVDSGPVLERTWAARAGLGWIGKNSLVLRRDLGSWFFLGVILTTVELEAESPVADACGTCTACLDACPTGAIVAAQTVDSNKCISYQTIENRSKIPTDLHFEMGKWLFGCDICQEVCPWNRFATPTGEADFAPRPGVANPEPEEILGMGEAGFHERFAGTPVMRAKFEGIRRNAAIVRRNLVEG